MAEELNKEVVGEGEPAVPAPEPPKIKIGEEEFTEEQARALLDLGKIAKQAEEEYHRPIKSIWPEYVESQKELKALKDKAVAPSEPPAPAQELNEEQSKIATGVLEKMGFLHKGNVRDEVLTILEDYMTVQETANLLDEAKAEKRPAEELKNFLAYMDSTGIRDPKIAYKVRFEKELEALNQAKVEGLKPKGLTTQEIPAGGGRSEPEPTPIRTKTDLEKALKERFSIGKV